MRKTDAPNAEGGFSLIEVMIAIVVMSVGLLAVVASLATALAATQSGEEDLIARQKALEAMESIYTARNSQQIPFAAVAPRRRQAIRPRAAQAMRRSCYSFNAGPPPRPDEIPKTILWRPACCVCYLMLNVSTRPRRADFKGGNHADSDACRCDRLFRAHVIGVVGRVRRAILRRTLPQRLSDRGIEKLVPQ